MNCYVVPGHDPAFYLALEAYLLEHMRQEDILVLSINEPSIVCGKYQNIYGEANVWNAHKQGIRIVRRESGGGTVYHDPGNLNYSIITDLPPMIDYDAFLAPMLEALTKTGVPCHKNRVCDIAIDGRKISGSAQRATRGRILHHSTLLFRSDLHVLHQVLDRTGRHYESKAIASVPSQVTNISEHMAEDMDIEQFRDRLIAHYPADLTLCTLSQEQLAQVRELAATQYETWEWNCGKSPAFSCTAQAQFAGQPFHLSYSAKKGVIVQCEIQSPALPADCGRLFEGQRLEPDAIEAICTALVPGRPQELATLIF